MINNESIIYFSRLGLNMSRILSPVCCHTCEQVIGLIPLGWEVPQFMVCIPCRQQELAVELK